MFTFLKKREHDRKSKNYLCFFLLIIGTLLLTIPAAADTNPFRIAGDYNGFIFEDVEHVGGISEGALALGGNADLTKNVSIGTLLPPGGNSVGIGMVVGGNSDWTEQAGNSGQVIEGDMHVGGTVNHESVGILNGTLYNPSFPINFTAEEEYLKSLSAYWANLSEPPGTTVTITGSGANKILNLTGTSPTLNVFHVDDTDWSKLGDVTLNVPPNSSVIINVDRTNCNPQSNLDMRFNGNNSGAAWQTTIWNFYNATKISIDNMDWKGSILAPYADFEYKNSKVEGQLIAKSLENTNSADKTGLYFYPFRGVVPIPLMIDLKKLTNGNDSATPPGPIVPVGETITWEYQVNNTGNVNLTNITVTDDQGVTPVYQSGDVGDDDILEPGEVWIYNATGIATGGQYTNVGNATGEFYGINYSDDDSSYYFGANASITLAKLTNGNDSATPPGPIVPVGETITWEYQVNNTGNVNLTNIAVTDDQGVTPVYQSGDVGDDDILEPGEVWIYNATGIATGGQYTNVGNATGEYNGTEYYGEDSSYYFGANASITLAKLTNGNDSATPPGPIVPVGETITWEYQVNNTGNVNFTNITVTDDQGVTPVYQSGDVGDDDILEPGEVWIYNATGIATGGQYTNVGNATGEYNGNNYSGEGSSYYFGANASITLAKLTNGNDSATPPGPIVPVGETITWEYQVNNTGNVNLTNITVTDDQGVTPVYQSGDVGDDDILEPGEVWIYNATGIATGGQYTNVGNATGEYNGNNYSGEGSSYYFGSNASIDIEKSTNGENADTPPGPTIPIGNDVIWIYNVTNTGNVNLTNINVTDDQGGVNPVYLSGDNGNNILEPGEVWTYNETGTATLGQYANNGTATGHYNGFSVNDTDPSHYFGSNASIDIEKSTNGEDADTPPGPTIPIGNDVIWIYNVTNTGNVNLTNINVTDDQGGVNPVYLSGDNGNNILEPGEVWTYNETGTATLGQYANNGTATGHYNGFSVNDTDPSHYFGSNASIDIEKSTNGEDADTPPGPTIPIGNDVIWIYNVTNTGNVNLTNINVTDDQGGVNPVYLSGDNGNNILEPGEVWTYNETGTATLGQYANNGMATGHYNGFSVNDSDPSHYFGSNASIDIEKSTNGEDADTPPGPTIPIGNDVIWIYNVTNTGNVNLTNINVTDDQGGVNPVYLSGDNGNNILEPGEVWTYNETGTATLGQYANNGTATGHYNGFSVNDTDPSHYFGSNASIDIEKSTNGEDADTPPGPTIPIGNDVIWIYNVTNTGNVNLTNINVTDDQGGVNPVYLSGDNGNNILEPGEVWTYNETGTATLGQYANNGTATGHYNGFSVNDTDPSHYFGSNASIDIEKSTNGEDADTPPGPTIPIGNDVIWIYNVTNTGNVNLTNINVTDDQGGVNPVYLSGDNGNNILEPGEVWTYNETGTATLGQYANNGTATGHYNGFSVNDTDPSHYFGSNASIDIEKSTNGEDADTPPGPTIPIGNDVIWIYNVTNTGNVNLTNINVTDDQGGVNPVYLSGDNGNNILEPGEVWTYNETGTATLGQYANNGTATGHYNGFSVNDTDPSHYFGSNASIDIEKSTNGEDADTPPGPTIPIGNEVIWIYNVTNTGNVNLTNINVTDDQGGVNPAYLSGDNGNNILEPGEVWTYNETGTATLGQYANNGTATGHYNGFSVNDTDPSHYLGSNASIDIEKSTNGEDADTPPGPTIPIGNDVIWIYNVTNTGNVNLTNINVTDDQGGVNPAYLSGGNGNNILEPGEVWTYNATGTATLGQYANNGTAKGDYNGFSVNDSDPSHYFGSNASIDIEKSTNGKDADTPPGPTIPIGNDVIWIYNVTNTGNVNLTNINVTDDQGGVNPAYLSGDNGNNILEPGEVWTYNETGTATLGQYSNNGTATGHYNGFSVNDTDPSHYFGSNASIDIEKSTNGKDADTPPGPTIPIGNDVIWIYNVTNTGNVNLTNINVTDDQGGVNPAYLSGDNGNNILEPGEVWTYNETGTATLGQYSNNGTATGHYNGFSVNDTDPSHYLGEEAPAPAIDIEKSTNGCDADTSPGTSITVGNNVTWEYVVSNPSIVNFMNIVVTDDQGVTPVYQSGDDGDNVLEQGEVWIYKATGTATLGQYANIGNVTGQYNGTNYSDEDPSHYNGISYGCLGPVYALSFAFPGVPQFAFYDYNINGGTVGAFDDDDSGYIDMDGDGVIDPNIDVRITPWHNVPANDSQFKYPANTKVANDDDQGRPLVVPAGGQVVLYFIDLENDGRYDIEDPIYVDVNAGDGGLVVEVHDIRLTANGWGYSAYTTVGAYDGDKGQTLTLMPDNPDNPAAAGTFADLLGYIDDDCSTDWTCPDKLYLQQPKNNDTTGASGDFDVNANFFVTIGDLRIYIPPAIIENEYWPSCGTKVEEGDIDAVYTLSTPTNPANGQIGVRIGFYDFSGGDGVFDGIDSAYIDIVNISGSPGVVDNGDVRITPWPNVPEGHPDFKYPANTKVINENDQGMPLLYPSQAGLIKFFDVNNAAGQPGYDISDPLYVDMDNNSIISLYDIRLTPREEYGYKAYTTVRAGDLDLHDPWPFWPVGEFTTTPAQLIGYIDDDCSGTWTCPDKLYLEQPIYNVTTQKLLGFDRFVTIGDMRLYIPPEAIANECWPSCGTKVELCDVDAVYVLKNLGIATAELKFYDYDGDLVFDDRDTLYIDVDNSNNVIEAGDIRLTPWHNVPANDLDFKYPANTKVANDLDLNKPLIPLTPGLATPGLGYNVAFFDINGDMTYDLGDPLYIDISSAAGLGRVSLFDVRLTPTKGYDAAYTTVRAGDSDLVEARVLDVHPLGGAIANSIGYIDSDCSDTWTCVDKLYLNQVFPPLPAPVPGLVGFATIGDLRLYPSPEKIYDDDEQEFWVQYDTNPKDGEINDDEVLAALGDYFDPGSEMIDDQILNVLGKYFS